MKDPPIPAPWCARAAGAILLLLELTATQPLLAQSLPTATLAGKVSAEDGSGLPGIRIRLVSESLQGVRETSTSATGDFLVALLPTGVYTVTFHADGMQSVSRLVTLPTASTVRLDQRMRPAAVNESIAVAADSDSAAALAAPELRVNRVSTGVISGRILFAGFNGGRQRSPKQKSTAKQPRSVKGRRRPQKLWLPRRSLVGIGFLPPTGIIARLSHKIANRARKSNRRVPVAQESRSR